MQTHVSLRFKEAAADVQSPSAILRQRQKLRGQLWWMEIRVS